MVDSFELISRAKEEWESAVDAVKDLVFLTDGSGGVLRCNRAASETLGRAYDQILDRRLEDLFHAIVRPKDLPLASSSGQLVILEQNRVLEYSRFSATRNGQRLGFVFVFRDVTELRRLQAIASRVDMMNNMGQVLSCVRHEIGNPANAMNVALTVMDEGLRTFSPKKMRTYIKRCLDDNRRIQDLLDRLRTFSVFDVTMRERVDLRRFLEAEVPAIRDGLEKQGIRLTCSFNAAPDPLEAACDPRALYQVLLGIIANAREAVSLRPQAGRVHLQVFCQGRKIFLVVSDDGPGIEADHLDKVILPLFTTKRGGTGLGLAIAHELLTRMGGGLEIGNDSTLGGARVVLRLRRADASHLSEAVPSGSHTH